jgi:hypothetical protein
MSSSAFYALGMKRNASFLAALCLSAAVVSGCASTPDPAKVCTAEWITPRADRAVDRIEKRAKKSIKALSSAGQSLTEGKVPGPLQMLALSNAMKRLETELTKGKGITDLKTVARTCNEPEIVSDAMRDLFTRSGVPETYITRIEGSPYYQRMIDSITAPKPVTKS